ncbi:Alanine--tRNA ligase (Alanyl-tRNA synthetase) (AlaRS), partial [Durusdinium trenchii]
NIEILKLCDEVPALPEGPPVPALGEPEQYEPHPGLKYFCKMWKLNSAMEFWLQKLHPDVQEALIDEYDDSTVPAVLPADEEVRLYPSSSVAVGGIHRNITKEVLRRLFSRFGRVRSLQFVGTTAVVEMSSEEEAAIAVQDILLSLDWPGALVVYFFHQIPPVSIHEIPEGQRIFGTVKQWNSKSRTGWITVNGTGPDVTVTSNCLEDVVTLIPGAPVLFKMGAAYSDSWNKHTVQCCMGDREAIREHLSANFGTDCAVRHWARSLQHKLQKGSADI